MISFIYFDLGGVVIKDFSGNDGWLKMKQDLGVKPEDDERFDVFFDNLENEKLNVGKENLESAIPVIEKEFGITFPKNYSFLNDFVNRFGKNESIWPIIKKAKEHTKIGLLTNMYQGMLSAIKNKNIMPKVNWDLVVDSSVIGLRKPEEKIYKIAEKKSGVNKDQILFIDNSLKNIEAAKNFGWQTFLYDSANPEDSNQKLITLIH